LQNGWGKVYRIVRVCEDGGGGGGEGGGGGGGGVYRWCVCVCVSQNEGRGGAMERYLSHTGHPNRPHSMTRPTLRWTRALRRHWWFPSRRKAYKDGRA
jgi:hypothetical protein